MIKIIAVICIIALAASILYALHIMNKDYEGE